MKLRYSVQAREDDQFVALKRYDSACEATIKASILIADGRYREVIVQDLEYGLRVATATRNPDGSYSTMFEEPLDV